MLSDGIFAIATTLAALEIRLPTGLSDPRSALLAFWSPLLTYAVSFGVIAVFWLGSRNLFARLARVTGPVTVLTLIMLCLVALIPIGVRAMTDNPANLPFHIYTIIMFSSGLVNSVLWTYVCFAPGVMQSEVPKLYRWERALASLAMPLLFAPLMFIDSDRLVPVLLPTAILVGVGRRVVLPRVLKRIFPEDGTDSPVVVAEDVSTQGSVAAALASGQGDGTNA